MIVCVCSTSHKMWNLEMIAQCIAISFFFIVQPLSYTNLWNSSADYEPGLLAHRQEVVAQKYSMFFLVSSQQGEELLKTRRGNKAHWDGCFYPFTTTLKQEKCPHITGAPQVTHSWEGNSVWQWGDEGDESSHQSLEIRETELTGKSSTSHTQRITQREQSWPWPPGGCWGIHPEAPEGG